MPRRGPSRKARRGQIQPPPEDVHRARLADELAAELLEDVSHALQHPPERRGPDRIVRRVLEILRERDRLPHLHRTLEKSRADAERVQRGLVLPEELRHRPRRQSDPDDSTVARTQLQYVPREVKLDLQRPLPPGHGRRGEPPRAHVQGHVPPVVLERRQHEPRLSHDLRPHVQRGARLLPAGYLQRRPLHASHYRSGPPPARSHPPCCCPGTRAGSRSASSAASSCWGWPPATSRSGTRRSSSAPASARSSP